jgi:hypothetical protein
MVILTLYFVQYFIPLCYGGHIKKSSVKYIGMLIVLKIGYKILIHLIFLNNSLIIIFLLFKDASEHLHSKSFIYSWFNSINCVSNGISKN